MREIESAHLVRREESIVRVPFELRHLSADLKKEIELQFPQLIQRANEESQI